MERSLFGLRSIFLYHRKLPKIDLAVLRDWNTGKPLISKQLPVGAQIA